MGLPIVDVATLVTAAAGGYQDFVLRGGELLGNYSAVRATIRGIPDCEAHHIIQNAAVRGMVGPSGERYSRSRAPAVVLTHSQHLNATRMQRCTAQQGTFGDEKDVARRALAAAGQSPSASGAPMSAVRVYFEGQLRFTDATATNTLGSGWRTTGCG